MKEKDKVLIQHLGDKNYKALFELLLVKYKKPLYAMLYKIVKNHDDTDDALQNTYIKVWENLLGFKEESTLFSWMYTIAKNEGLMILRKNKKILDNTNNDFLINSTGLNYAEDEIYMLLYNALAQLPEKQKYVFELKYFAENTYEEIKDKTDTSIGALKASYFHALQKIGKYIKLKNTLN